MAPILLQKSKIEHIERAENASDVVAVDNRLVAPVGGLEFDLAGLGIRLVDENDDRAELLADRVPKRLAAGSDAHVTLTSVLDPGRVAQSYQQMPAGRDTVVTQGAQDCPQDEWSRRQSFF